MSHRSCVQSPQGASFRKRNCCWVSWAASVKIAKKPRAEHPFAAFFIVNYAGSRCVSCGVLLSLSLCCLLSLSLFLFIVLFLSLSFFRPLSLSPLSLSLSLCSLSLSLLSSLFSLSLSSLYLSISLSFSLSLSSQPKLTTVELSTVAHGEQAAESDYQPPDSPFGSLRQRTRTEPRLYVFSGREPPDGIKHRLALQ